MALVLHASSMYLFRKIGYPYKIGAAMIRALRRPFLQAISLVDIRLSEKSNQCIKPQAVVYLVASPVYLLYLETESTLHIQ